MFKRLEIDPSKVNNLFALFTVFLLVSEGLLGFWISQAADSTERIIAGTLMALVFIGSLLLFFQLIKNKMTGVSTPKALDEKVTPASKEVSMEEIRVIASVAMNATQISGPEGTYSIDSPPSNWKVKKLTLAGLMQENLGMKDGGLIESLFGSARNLQNENILLLQSNTSIELIPIPGKTVINGATIPTALTTKLPLQLSIIPLERLQPPFYTENSFEHNVFSYIGQVLNIGVIKMKSHLAGTIKETNREFIQVDMVQELEHADIAIDSQVMYDCPKLRTNITVIAIKGDIIDHLLIMNYPTIENMSNMNFLGNELSTLKSLVNSFKPLKILDPIRMINTIKEKGKVAYEDLITQSGYDIFISEFGLALSKIKSLNFNNAEERGIVIRTLKPFEKFYHLLKIQDEGLESFFEALGEAEKGNHQELLEQVEDLTEEMNDYLLGDKEEQQGRLRIS